MKSVLLSTPSNGFYSSWHGKGYVKEVNVIDLTEELKK